VNTRVGIVVPTLGSRPNYLQLCLESIGAAGDAYVCLVAPENFDSSSLLEAGLVDQVLDDLGNGLAEAINYGIKKMPNQIEYVNWLGDDDLLAEGTLEKLVATLDGDPTTVLVYGSCNYINAEGDVVWRNRSGKWASPLLHFGPDLIPQPGALFRKNAFEKVGGLSSVFDWAFDFDLLLKLKKVGKLRFIDQTLASFRWHQDSLSVGQRANSVAEASRVRISHLPGFLRPISFLWEFPVSKATLVAGNRLSARTKRHS